MTEVAMTPMVMEKLQFLASFSQTGFLEGMRCFPFNQISIVLDSYSRKQYNKNK